MAGTHARHPLRARPRLRMWLLLLAIVLGGLIILGAFTVIQMAIDSGLSLPRWTLAQSQTASVPAENPILYAKAAWHKQAHPMAEQIKEVTPSFPRAGLWTALSAVPCLRKAFRDQGPQDMRVYSQWGEDGILESIFKCIGVTDRSFAEFGTEDGSECTTRWLREAHGFKGLLMDGSHSNPDINLQQERIYAENISAVLHKHEVPYPAPDQMTIDIDLNTWHVTAAVMKGGWRPRSLTIEFNRNFLPHQAYTSVYWPDKGWQNEDCYFGGSALAFVRLLSQYRYELIAVDQFGINLFFVHNSALGWWPGSVHANTPPRLHPLQQVWPHLHKPCRMRAWVEVPENYDRHTWDQSVARRVVLDNQDRPDTFRVLFESHTADSVGNATDVSGLRADQAKAEFSRYESGLYTLHNEGTANAFAARLRVPEYAGKRVADLPNDPKEQPEIVTIGKGR